MFRQKLFAANAADCYNGSLWSLVLIDEMCAADAAYLQSQLIYRFSEDPIDKLALPTDLSLLLN
jgi:hypothetical protein